MNKSVVRLSRAPIALLLVAAWTLSCAQPPNERVLGRDSRGSRKLVQLDTSTIPALRDSFNAAEGSARILVMLSPT